MPFSLLCWVVICPLVRCPHREFDHFGRDRRKTKSAEFRVAKLDVCALLRVCLNLTKRRFNASSVCLGERVCADSKCKNEPPMVRTQPTLRGQQRDASPGMVGDGHKCGRCRVDRATVLGCMGQPKAKYVPTTLSTRLRWNATHTWSSAHATTAGQRSAASVALGVHQRNEWSHEGLERYSWANGIYGTRINARTPLAHHRSSRSFPWRGGRAVGRAGRECRGSCGHRFGRYRTDDSYSYTTTYIG